MTKMFVTWHMHTIHTFCLALNNFYLNIFMFRFAYGTTKAAVIGLTKEKI